MLIYDEEQLRLFYDTIWKELKPNEVNFFSMAARNKYLSDEERTTVKLNNSSTMFNRTILKDRNYDFFYGKMKQLEAMAPYAMDQNYKFIPEKCMMFYANVNPSNSIAAMQEFKGVLAESDREFVGLAMNGGDLANALNRFNMLPHTLTTCFQKNRGTKYWLDIDCDTEKSDTITLSGLKDNIKANFEIDCNIIETHGGYHILLKKDTIKSDPNQVVKWLQGIVFPKAEEVKFNENQMVPIPGTLQGGFEVKMV